MTILDAEFSLVRNIARRIIYLHNYDIDNNVQHNMVLK